MHKLLTAVLAASVLIAPAAFAQEAPRPADPAATAPAPAAGPAPGSEAAPAPSAAGTAPGAAGAAPETEAAPSADQSPETGTGGPSAAATDAEHEAEETPHYPLNPPEEMNWSFSGWNGRWDLGQLQRGLKVYKDVCSSCHSLDLVAFRDIGALGYDAEQVKAFAAEYTVQSAEPNAAGDLVERPGIPSDYFPSPYPNVEAAAAANNGAAPPDLSLMAKARAVQRGFPQFVFDILPWIQYAEGGPDYIHALLTGYEEAPAHIEVQPGTYYNPSYIAGPALAMAQPIFDDQVTYDDGTPQTLDQYARDVSAFLMWTAEPHLAERKATGFLVMLFLVILAALVYMVKRRVWADTPH